MNKGKDLIKNTAIYAIANFGSKILSFLIVPLYTHYLAPDAMGTYDLIITTITLLVPFLTFQMSDGIYRWLLDPDQDRARVLRVGLEICIRNFIVSALIYIAVCLFVDIPYAGYFFVLLLAYSIVPIFQQAVRGLGNNKLYALSGILLTALFLGGNVVFVIYMRWGCEGMLLSQIVAYVIVGVLLVACCPQLRQFIHAPRDKVVQRSMMTYSLPLIPNVVSWWAINTANRYIILAFLGKTANGIFAISMKFPSVLQMCTSIFYLAWQEAAIKDSQGKGDSAFSNYVFRIYARLLFLLAAICIPLTRIVVAYFMDAAYADSWRYCSFLYLGMVFSALASFIGTAYQASRQTKGALYTTIWAALLSVAVAIGLISVLGLQAVGLSVFVSYVFLFLIRIKSCGEYMHLNVNLAELALLTAYTLLITAVCSFAGIRETFALTVITAIVFLVVQRKELLQILGKVKKLIKGRRP